MSRIRSIPTAPMSSSRPRNGLMYVDPALAESSAWGAEKQSVWFTRIPCPERCFTALSPSLVSGHFTTTFGATCASSSPSFTIPSKSVATTSRLTSPGTIEQISSTSGRNGRFSLAASDGLVVTPSTTPSAMPSRISFTFAVSRKIFIGSSLGCLSARLSLSARLYRNAGTRADTLQRPGVADDVPDDVDGAGGPDLVAAAHGGGSEEDAEGLAGRPVAEVPQLHDLARRLLGEGQADVEVSRAAPRRAARRDRQRRGDGGRRPRVVQLGRDGDTARCDPDRFHSGWGPRNGPQFTWGPRHGPQTPKRSSRPGEPGELLGSACRRGTAPRPPPPRMGCGEL